MTILWIVYQGSVHTGWQLVLHSQAAFFLLYWRGEKSPPQYKRIKRSGYTRLVGSGSKFLKTDQYNSYINY